MDRGVALRGVAQRGEHRGEHDEEREQRQHRHVGEVSGVDETVVVGAGEHALEHREDARAGAHAALDLALQLAAQRRLAPAFGREVVMRGGVAERAFFHRATSASDAEPAA